MYSSYENKYVRDLAWLLDHGQDLLVSLPPFEPYQSSTTDEEVIDWLQAQTLQPKLLSERLGRTDNHRLGKYFEDLIMFHLQHGPGIQEGNWQRNVPIRVNEGKTARRTLGELDFLRRGSAESVHMEVAVKFFLGIDNQWLGPDPRDSWTGKCQHMSEHQLPLSVTAAEHLGLEEPVKRCYWVKGYLFQHWLHPTPWPLNALRNKLCLWLYASEVELFLQEHHRPWSMLQRTEWLGALHPKQASRRSLEPKALASAIQQHFSGSDRAIMASCALPHCTDCQRLLVVDDRWPALSPAANGAARIGIAKPESRTREL